MTAFALLRCHGQSVLPSNLIPSYKPKPLDVILSYLCEEDRQHYRTHLQSIYEGVVQKLDQADKGLMHQDPKLDNLARGHILDLEALRMGPAEIGLSLYLVQTGTHPCIWPQYIKTYLSVIAQETDREYSDHELVELTAATLDAAVLTVPKEMAGLESRPKGRRERQQHAQLRSFLQQMHS